jgi:hypothetical protein
MFSTMILKSAKNKFSPCLYHCFMPFHHPLISLHTPAHPHTSGRLLLISAAAVVWQRLWRALQWRREDYFEVSANDGFLCL